uniref:VHS domain-containing protein n=1 Tax=Panagrolaimus davidi TaxID=227884 RepID=A0A914P1P8_9BILA
MSKQFERTLEAATDQVVVDTDWSGIMECIDMVRGKDVSAKDAAAAISRRLKNSNPNIVHHTLVLLEACMKNCGTAVSHFYFIDPYLAKWQIFLSVSCRNYVYKIS